MLLGEVFHFFLPRTLYARHPEASRVTTHEALSRLWRAHAALLFLPSPPACAMGFLLLRGLFAFFATSTRCALSVELTLQGLGQRGVSGTAFGLLPGLCGASFVQHQSLEKTTFSPCMAKIFVLRLGNAGSQSLQPSTLLLFSKLRRCPLYLLLVWRLSPELSPICEKETAVQGSPIAFSAAVPQTNLLPLETPPPRRFIPTLSLFLRKASPLISVQRHLYSSTTFVCSFRCAKVFLRRTDVVGEMASKWVWTSPASNCETILLYSFVLVVHPLLVVCIQVQTCSPTLPVLSRIVPLASGNPKSWKAKSVELRKCLTRAFRSSAPEKILGEIYLEDGVAPVLQQTFQCWKSLLQIFHLHLCDMDLRNKIVEKRYFWEQGLQLFFCFAVCFGFDSRYSVNDSTARSICWNGVQLLSVFVGASKCFSHKVGNA